MHDEPYDWRCPECRAMDRYWPIEGGGFQCQCCGHVEAGAGAEQVAAVVEPGSGAGSAQTEASVPDPTTQPAGAHTVRVVWPVLRGRIDR